MGRFYGALGPFRIMQGVGFEINYISLLNLFPAVWELAELLLCRSLHGFVVRRGFVSSVFNGLIDTYSTSGEVVVASRIFDGMLGTRYDVSWSSMMSGYFHNGVFRRLRSFLMK